MLISKKLKTFSAPFLKSTSNFGHFFEKDDPHKLSFSEIMDC